MESSRKHWAPHPREFANFFSLFTFTWTAKIFLSDYKEKITPETIWGPYSKHKSALLGEKLEKNWKNQLGNTNKTPSLMKALYLTFWKDILFIAVIHVFQQTIDVFLRPKFLGLTISYFNAAEQIDLNTALSSGLGLLLTALVTNVLVNHYMANAFTLGLKMRAACVSLVYRKSLRMSKTALGEASAGQIVNLVSNDVSRFDFVVFTMNFLWSAPLIAMIITYFLYDEVGYAGFAGMAVIYTIAPIQTYCAKLTTKFRRQIAHKADERIRLTDEVLGGIHVIKTFAWEKVFMNLLEWARKKELKSVKYANYLRGTYMTFNLSTTRIALFCTLAMYVFKGEALNAGKVFVTTSYFGILSGSMCSVFVRGVSEVSECFVSVQRLQKFMLNDEVESFQISDDLKSNVKSDENICHNKVNKNGFVNNGYIEETITDKLDEKTSVTLQNVNASWSKSAQENILKNLNLMVLDKKLIAVIGRVGSGKSSLLQLMLGEMKIKGGEMRVKGKISYTSQEPWLFGGTIMQNILLGLPFNKERYNEVIHACSLNCDLELFPKGDQTEVGERGTSLSGGQKARINLARAIYKEADIYLLDDPLSAVDAHVAQNLFKQCFKGFLKDKIVFIVTHQLQFVQECDHMIFLKEGTIQYQGTFTTFLNKDDEFGRDMFSKVNEIDIKNEGNEPKQKRHFERMLSVRSTKSVSTVADDISTIDELEGVEEYTPKKIDSLTEMQGAYKGNVFLGYIKTGSSFTTLVFFITLLIASQVLASLSDIFVSYWTTQEELILATNNGSISVQNFANERTLNVTIFGLLVFSLFVVAFTRGIIFYVMCKNCSKGLHSQMLKTILSTDLGFFNKNPSGAILNRFSRDLGSTDELLPKSVLDSGQVFGQVLGAIIISMIVNIWFAIPALIFFIITITVRHYYMKTALNLKSIENTVRSPVFTHLNTSLQGLATIRAHGSQERLIEQFDLHQDLHTGALYTFVSTQQAYTFCLDLLGLIYLSCVIFTFMLFKQGAYGADVGLAITQSLVVTSLLQWGIRQSSEVVNLLTSVERLLLFIQISEEETDKDKKLAPQGQWPKNGEIKCHDLILKYNSDDPPVLKIHEIHIKSGEKIGIVGRTGAGKSSFISALFRLAHVEGQILIDGIDTSTLPLNFLRSKICIIPQNPVLFSGTLRMNLDPFLQHPDYVLWKALNEVELDEILKYGFGLNTKIADGGSNLSVGQRQLICLARAIVKNSKIIILDEATASVDPKTDDVIQKVIRKKFEECTVLVIAHRLNTVIDSDRIMVMDAGCMVEFDHPLKLLANKNGYFYRLMQETGGMMASQLVDQAHKAHKEYKKEI